MKLKCINGWLLKKQVKQDDNSEYKEHIVTENIACVFRSKINSCEEDNKRLLRSLNSQNMIKNMVININIL